jgi:TonB family protein
MRVWMTILSGIWSRMRRDAHSTDVTRATESLEDLVYRPRLAAGNRAVRGANPLITVPLTLLGYLVLAFLGWQVVKHSKSLLRDIPKSISVDLQDTGEGEAPPAANLAQPPAPMATPPGAIEKPDAPPPPIPANPDAVPATQPTELPTQDLGGVAFPTRPDPGPGGTGTGTSMGEASGSGTGSGQGPRVVGFDFSQVEVKYQPKLEYPAMAYRAGIQGTVKVTITVGLDGLPISAKAFEGPRLLCPPAEAYAMKWQFKPSTENGVPVLATFVLTVVFKIK